MGADKNRRGYGNEREAEPFLLIRRALWHSPTISAASPSAKALMIEMQSIYNGTNNGMLFLSVRDAAARLGFSDSKAAQRAFDELEALKLITETIGSSFRSKADKVSRARGWRLNWINPKTGKCVGELPPLDFGALTATQKRRVNARQSTLKRYVKEYVESKTAVVDSSTLDARRELVSQSAVVDSSTPKSKNGAKLPNSFVGDSSTHINTIGIGNPDGSKGNLPASLISQKSRGPGWWGTDANLCTLCNILELYRLSANDNRTAPGCLSADDLRRLREDPVAFWASQESATKAAAA